MVVYKCRKCGGYGHIQVECANTKKKNRSYMVTWSEDKSEHDKEVENNEHVAFITLSKNTAGRPQIQEVHGVISKAIQTTVGTHSLSLNQISHDDQTSDEE